MLYAQVGQHHLARTTETSLEPNPGTLSCLSARPHDLADSTVERPKVACVPLPGVPFVYSKRAAAARSPRSPYPSITWCALVFRFNPCKNGQSDRSKTSTMDRR